MSENVVWISKCATIEDEAQENYQWVITNTGGQKVEENLQKAISTLPLPLARTSTAIRKLRHHQLSIVNTALQGKAQLGPGNYKNVSAVGSFLTFIFFFAFAQHVDFYCLQRHILNPTGFISSYADYSNLRCVFTHVLVAGNTSVFWLEYKGQPVRTGWSLWPAK